MIAQIRQAELCDLPYLYEICLKTGADGKDGTPFFTDPYMVGQYFAAPYVHYDRESCFVASLAGVPKGYIIGALDTEDYYRWLEETWLPPLRKVFPPQDPQGTPQEAFLSRMIHEPPQFPQSLKDYPSHLHIDLLPDLQGMGMGRKLMETFIESLKVRKSPGLHLGVSRKNSGAVAFYEKMGFKVLQSDADSLVLGRKLI